MNHSVSLFLKAPSSVGGLAQSEHRIRGRLEEVGRDRTIRSNLNAVLMVTERPSFGHNGNNTIQMHFSSGRLFTFQNSKR